MKVTHRIKQNCSALNLSPKDTIAEEYLGLFYRAHSFLPLLPLLFSVVTVMMWPLAVYHRLWDRAYVWLKPALQRLDFSVRGYMMSKQRERQCKSHREASFHLGNLGKRKRSLIYWLENGRSGGYRVVNKSSSYSRETCAGLLVLIGILDSPHFKQLWEKPCQVD
jgi:hypothetical protein